MRLTDKLLAFINRKKANVFFLCRTCSAWLFLPPLSSYRRKVSVVRGRAVAKKQQSKKTILVSALGPVPQWPGSLEDEY